MNDLISRQAAIAFVDCGYLRPPTELAWSDKDVVDMLKRVPSAQPERIKGRWERKESDLSWWYECSECGESPLFDPYENEVLTRFCPWCGAEMKGEEE